MHITSQFWYFQYLLYTWIVEPHPNHKGIYFLAITIVLFQFISFHYFCFCEYRISFFKRDRLPWSFLDYFYLLKQKNSVCIKLKHLNSLSLHKNNNNFATISNFHFFNIINIIRIWIFFSWLRRLDSCGHFLTILISSRRRALFKDVEQYTKWIYF